jgi:hypothetical protein
MEQNNEAPSLKEIIDYMVSLQKEGYEVYKAVDLTMDKFNIDCLFDDSLMDIAFAIKKGYLKWPN